MPTASQLIIFDWDGTLMDSVARIVACMQAAAAESGWPVPDEQAVHDIIGLSLRVAIPRLFGERSAAEIDAFIDGYRDHYLYRCPVESPLFAGVREVLAQLRARGYRLAVATGKARAGLNRVLTETGLGEMFVDTIAADEARSKPDPLMLQQLLARNRVAVQQAIMVGDSEHDMAMAAAIDMPRIGITWGVHDAARLQQHAPLAVVDDLQALLGLLP